MRNASQRKRLTPMALAYRVAGVLCVGVWLVVLLAVVGASW